MINDFGVEFIKLLIFTGLNGFFAGSEIAIISIRRTRVEELVKKGSKTAKIIQSLQNDPERFIATGQIGISVVTIVASLVTGSNMEEIIRPLFTNSNVGIIQQNAVLISNTIVIALVSFLTIIAGELVPKSLALRYSEQVSNFVAWPIYWISKVCYLLIKFLTFCSNVLLMPFKDSTSFSETKLSEDEIRNMILEGRKAGTIERKEHEILENVFEFTDTTVNKIMTPAAQITAFDIDLPVEINISKVIESEYSRVPFFKGKLDNIIGILNVKDLHSALGTKRDFAGVNLRDLLSTPIFVPESQKVMTLLQKFQKNKTHIAIVSDEHGDVSGLVTLEDLIEEIVGEISDETDEDKKKAKKQDDGTFMIEGSMPIVDFNRDFAQNLGLELPENEQYTTISGFILAKLERFPEIEDKVKYENVEFVVKEKTNRTIKQVQVEFRKVVSG